MTRPRTKTKRTAASTPEISRWQRLFDLSEKVFELKPWAWLPEDQLFAVSDPRTEQLGFVSVMGALGEHLAIAAYQGLHGLHGFCQLQEADSSIAPELFFPRRLFRFPTNGPVY